MPPVISSTPGSGVDCVSFACDAPAPPPVATETSRGERHSLRRINTSPSDGSIPPKEAMAALHPPSLPTSTHRAPKRGASARADRVTPQGPAWQGRMSSPGAARCVEAVRTHTPADGRPNIHLCKRLSAPTRTASGSSRCTKTSKTTAVSSGDGARCMDARASPSIPSVPPPAPSANTTGGRVAFRTTTRLHSS